MIFVLRYHIDGESDVFVGSYNTILQDLIRLLQQRLPPDDPHRRLSYPFSDDDQHEIFESAAKRMKIRFDMHPLGG